jgi:hypothetical protein
MNSPFGADEKWALSHRYPEPIQAVMRAISQQDKIVQASLNFFIISCIISMNLKAYLGFEKGLKSIETRCVSMPTNSKERG